MNIIVIIEYIAMVLAGLYLLGLAMMWFLGLKKNICYSRMQNQIKVLESMSKSSAVVNARKYQINQDYQKSILALEKNEQFVLENILLTRKGSLKTKYKL